MNRWAIRLAGVLMLLVFMFMFVSIYKQLVQLQRMQNQPAATSTR
jgi:hypothetical protein